MKLMTGMSTQSDYKNIKYKTANEFKESKDDYNKL